MFSDAEGSDRLTSWLREELSRTGQEPASPKLGGRAAGPLYRYYAGYADDFVDQVIVALPKLDGPLLDPWNGSGTTTRGAASHGLSAVGFDLNPVAVTIAKARLLQADIEKSIEPIVNDVVEHAEPVACSDMDPLLLWFGPTAAGRVRGLERSVSRLLVPSTSRNDDSFDVDDVSPLAALFYVALFRLVREFLKPFLTTNPTWIRRRIASSERLRMPQATIESAFRAHVIALTAAVVSEGLTCEPQGRIKVGAGPSGALPLENGSVGGVISSPPYCTRIDYVVSTSPELSIIGLSHDAQRQLRDEMIGTTTVHCEEVTANDAWGPSAVALLDQVRRHSSRASDGYYARFFAQYFGGMRDSISELARVLKPGAPVVLVAQDSFYKEIHIDVATCIEEMTERVGWTRADRHGFLVNTKAHINAGSRAYRDTETATESVMVFEA